MNTDPALDPITPLAEAHAANQADPAARDLLWRTVFALPEWHLLEHSGQGEMPRILTATQDGRSCVLAFTSRARAEIARAHFASVMPGRQIGVLSLRRLGAAARACSEKQAEFLLFNQGTGGPGFAESLESIAAMQEFFLGELPEGCLDRLASMALRIDQRPVWDRLANQVAKREQMVVMRSGPNEGILVVTVNERRAMLAFTHPGRVSFGAAQVNQAAGREVTQHGATMSGTQFARIVAAARAQPPGTVTHIVFNLGTQPFGLPLDDYALAVGIPT